VSVIDAIVIADYDFPVDIAANFNFVNADAPIRRLGFVGLG
jgi:hypothetical protein